MLCDTFNNCYFLVMYVVPKQWADFHTACVSSVCSFTACSSSKYRVDFDEYIKMVWSNLSANSDANVTNCYTPTSIQSHTSLKRGPLGPRNMPQKSTWNNLCQPLHTQNDSYRLWGSTVRVTSPAEQKNMEMYKARFRQ